MTRMTSLGPRNERMAQASTLHMFPNSVLQCNDYRNSPVRQFLRGWTLSESPPESHLAVCESVVDLYTSDSLHLGLVSPSVSSMSQSVLEMHVLAKTAASAHQN